VADVGRVGLLWALFSLLLLVPTELPAGTLFDSNEPIEVRLTGPFGTLIRNKKNREELPFMLGVNGSDHEVFIRVRGHSRARVCEFPPLRLNFKTKSVEDSVFAGQDKLKLVNLCSVHDRGETDLLQEYVVYRIFNLITDLSYRVRLLQINYVDTDKKLGKKAAGRYGFVIESAPGFEKRVGTDRQRVRSLMRGTLDTGQAALVYVFQYLVANTDWLVVRAEGVDECCHNGDLYSGDAGLVYVPYDFDLTGVVNPRYGYPDRSLRISRVTQRLYRGLCMDRSDLQAALTRIRSLEEEILAIPQAVPGLPAKRAESTREFLHDFFVEAADEAALLGRFERDCITPRYRPVSH